LKGELDRWLEEDADDCLAAIGVEPGQSVMDFGCAKGAYSIPAARIVGAEGRVYALDKNADALGTLRRLASARGLTRVEALNTDGQVRVPLENESVNAVILHDVLHLIGWEEREGETIRRSTAADRRSLLEEVYRVMKWGGVLSVFGPHLVTHTDITAEQDLNREIARVGFRLEKEMYRRVFHDDRLEQGHLYAFRKRQASEPGLESFVYDTPSFQARLRQDAHHYGEVTLLNALADPGMVALELGANRGVTTIALSRGVGPQGRVHAFEPVPEYYASLLENLRLNEADNVSVHQLAVTDREGEVEYYKHGEGSGIVQADDAPEIMVGTTSLDNFVAAEALERVDLINMDCEGAELLALQGGEKTLRQQTPRIFCEIHHDYLSRLGQSVHDIVGYLRRLGFQVVPVRVEALEEDVEFKSCSHICAAANGKLPDIKTIARREQRK